MKRSFTVVACAVVARAVVACRSKEPPPPPPPPVLTIGADAVSFGAEHALGNEQLAGLARAGKLGPAPVRIVVEAGAPYRLLVETLAPLGHAGVTRFAIEAPGGDEVAIALPSLADRVPPADGGRARDGLGLVVAVKQRSMVVFSLSGEEGTLAQPLLEVARGGHADDLEVVQATLTEIIARRWGGTGAPPRPAIDRRLVIMADGDVPIVDVLPVIVGTRIGPRHEELFPDTVLSTGFE